MGEEQKYLTDNVKANLSCLFKIPELKEYQTDAIEAVLKGLDVFVGQPTGSGKSLIFQALPFAKHFIALEEQGLLADTDNFTSPSCFVVVISPLISLMRDQVKSLLAKGINAISLSFNPKVDINNRTAVECGTEDPGNSTSEPETCCLTKIINGCYEIIYTSPETLFKYRATLLKNIEFSKKLVAVAVDESHIVMKWGMGDGDHVAFRDWYGKIGELRSYFTTRIPLIALTATASKNVVKAVIDNLSLDRPLCFTKIPNKSNIFLSVVSLKSRDPELFLKPIVDCLIKNPYKSKRVLIFCRTMCDLQEAYGYIHSELFHYFNSYIDRPYAMYHATTEDKLKEHITNSFQDPDGSVRVLVCSVAFGLGIDCKGLNTVIHYGPPSDIDDYFQESGRCGRDGLQSVSVLLLYPKCLCSPKISLAMKTYATNKSCCRRNLILQNYEGNFDVTSCELLKHFCCDICKLTCQCLDNCEKFDVISNVYYPIFSDEAVVNQSRFRYVICEEGVNFLRNNLTILWEEFNTEVKGVHTVIGILSGFPFQAIEEVIECCQPECNIDVLRQKTSILEESIYPSIIAIINECFERFEYECEFVDTNLFQNESDGESEDCDVDFSFEKSYKPEFFDDE